MNLLSQIRSQACIDEFIKISSDNSSGNTGYIQGVLASSRASNIGDKVRNLIPKPEYVNHVIAGEAIGGVAGGTSGALLARGALAAANIIKRRNSTDVFKNNVTMSGIGVGSLLGLMVGGRHSQKEYFKDRGIDYKGGVITPMRSFNISDEAKKKYRVKD